jgi:hypothetical protein
VRKGLLKTGNPIDKKSPICDNLFVYHCEGNPLAGESLNGNLRPTLHCSGLGKRRRENDGSELIIMFSNSGVLPNR